MAMGINNSLLEAATRVGGKPLPASILALPEVLESLKETTLSAEDLHWSFVYQALLSGDERLQKDADWHVLGCRICTPHLVEFFRAWAERRTP